MINNSIKARRTIAGLSVALLGGAGLWLGAVAVTCATINTVGGFMITVRMLRMFRKKVG